MPNSASRDSVDDATRIAPSQRDPVAARLTIEARPGAVALEGAGPWLLGRAAHADVVFPDDRSCPGEQARIARDADAFVLEPLPDAIETALNGDAVAAIVRIPDGALITFAAQRMVFTLVHPWAGDMTVIGRTVDPVAAPERLSLSRPIAIERVDSTGQIVFDYPTISRRRAASKNTPSGAAVRDSGSPSGTSVKGVRVDRPARLAPSDKIDAGPFGLVFDGEALADQARTGHAELSIRDLCFDVPVARRGTSRILHEATFQILPSELVCIIGASGSGKSTLMNILAGRAAPSAGVVLLNGESLHARFEVLKQDIAFVPQQDVLHEQLTLRQALDYAARLRLPSDTSAAQRLAVIEAAVRSVDLLDRLDTRIARLSGGQKKRASLASEILNRPSLLFLDEVTSGLDESTDWEIMRLLRRLADEGMTIVVVTHSLANVEAFCHKIVCIGRGGHLTFVGAPDQALGFFGVSRLGEIFNRIEDIGVLACRAQYEESAATGDRTPVPLAAAAPTRRRGIGPLRHASRVLRQLVILTCRNTRLLLADRRTMIMATVQACFIGGIIGYAFGTFGQGQQIVMGKSALLFLLGLTSIWLGCNGASKDIVGELVIYKRERDIGLSTAAFVVSKFIVSSVFTVLQLGLMLGAAALLAQEIPGNGFAQAGILAIGAMAGVTLGLAISAFCNTRDQATTIVPLALAPQIILAKTLVPHLPLPAEIFAKIAIGSLWLSEAMKSVFIAAEGPVQIVSATTGRMVQMVAEPAVKDVLIVTAQAAVFLLIAYLAALLRHGRRRV